MTVMLDDYLERKYEKLISERDALADQMDEMEAMYPRDTEDETALGSYQELEYRHALICVDLYKTWKKQDSRINQIERNGIVLNLPTKGRK